MRTSVERLRIGLLVGAGLLVLVIATFLGYARYRVGKVIANLPGKLGATVTKEFNGYTYSQSDGKRTIFTIHAAKAMQHSDGKYTLRDVSMILYGHSGDRADRISGDDFEYDTKAQVVTAIGEVHLDLDVAAPSGPADSEVRKHLAGPATSGHEDESLGGHVIHVKTSGLVYTKQTGTAATNQGLEFSFGGFAGHAVGAEYNSTTGHVVLQSAITASGLNKGHPIALSAAHGEMDRTKREADFREARYSAAGQVARAETSQIHLREDNSIERIDCQGQVALEDGEQGRVTSERAAVSLDASNKPETALLIGAVRFNRDGPLRRVQGESERADLAFDRQGHLNHAAMHGHVKTVEVARSAGGANAARSERTLTGDGLEMWLAAEIAGTRPQVRDVKATGSVRVEMTEEQGATRKFAGDLLTAHLVPGIEGPELSTVHGSGHTVVEQTGEDGVFQKSTGDTLDAKFRPVAGAERKGSVALASAVQQGNVAIERSTPARLASAIADVQHATAKMAAFDADSDMLTLSGDVAMNDAGRQVLADRVVIARASGNAKADGRVRVTYLQATATESTHVLAARAELDRGANRAVFYGRGPGSAMARMWQAGAGGQGGSQIEAPVLIFEEVAGPRKASRLTARAETPGVPGKVQAVLVESRSSKSTAGLSQTPAARALVFGVARIVSSQMVYSDQDHKAEFSGGVRLTDGAGEMNAQDAVVFLTTADVGKLAANAKQAPTSGGLMGGSVERIVATQHIELMQPGRKATGERLVYTASDQMFVLTGTAAAPPRVVDAQQGSTTGAELRFHSGDNSVVISGTDGDATARKVQTETRVKQ